MKHKIELLEKVQALLKRSHGLRNRSLMHPRRDWLIGTGLLILIATVGGVLNARSHVTYQDVGSSQYNVEIDLVTYNEAVVTAVIEDYQARAARVAALVSSEVTDQTNRATSSDGAPPTPSDSTESTTPDLSNDSPSAEPEDVDLDDDTADDRTTFETDIDFE